MGEATRELDANQSTVSIDHHNVSKEALHTLLIVKLDRVEECSTNFGGALDGEGESDIGVFQKSNFLNRAFAFDRL